MSLYQINGIWQIEFRLGGNRHRKTTGTRDKAKAVRAEIKYKSEVKKKHEIRRARLSKGLIYDESVTLNQLCNSIIETKISRTGNFAFINNIRYAVESIGKTKPIAKLNDADVNRFILSERIRKTFVGRRRLRVTEPIEQFLADRGRNSRPPEKRLSNEALARICEELESEALDRIREGLDCPAPFENRTIVGSLLEPILNLCVHAESEKFQLYLPSRPQRSSHRYPFVNRNIVLSRRDEIRFEQAASPDLWAVCKFAIETMLRIENIVDLTWDEVDYALNSDEIGEIRTITKGTHNFTLRINSKAKAIIHAQRGKHPVYVFTHVDGRTGVRSPLTKEVSVRFTTLARRLGIRFIHFHDLRRTGASRLYQATHSLETVRIVLGHKDQRTTQKYITVEDADLRQAELMREKFDDEREREAREALRHEAEEAKGSAIALDETVTGPSETGERVPETTSTRVLGEAVTSSPGVSARARRSRPAKPQANETQLLPRPEAISAPPSDGAREEKPAARFDPASSRPAAPVEERRETAAPAARRKVSATRASSIRRISPRVTARDIYDPAKPWLTEFIYACHDERPILLGADQDFRRFFPNEPRLPDVVAEAPCIDLATVADLHSECAGGPIRLAVASSQVFLRDASDIRTVLDHVRGKFDHNLFQWSRRVSAALKQSANGAIR